MNFRSNGLCENPAELPRVPPLEAEELPQLFNPKAAPVIAASFMKSRLVAMLNAPIK
jgi:hypothetical protein